MSIHTVIMASQHKNTKYDNQPLFVSYLFNSYEKLYTSQKRPGYAPKKNSYGISIKHLTNSNLSDPRSGFFFYYYSDFDVKKIRIEHH